MFMITCLQHIYDNVNMYMNMIKEISLGQSQSLFHRNGQAGLTVMDAAGKKYATNISRTLYAAHFMHRTTSCLQQIKSLLGVNIVSKSASLACTSQYTSGPVRYYGMKKNAVG